MMFTGVEAHVTNIAVDPDLHGRKVGTRLLLALVTEAIARGAERISLEVRVYERRGPGDVREVRLRGRRHAQGLLHRDERGRVRDGRRVRSLDRVSPAACRRSGTSSTPVRTAAAR